MTQFSAAIIDIFLLIRVSISLTLAGFVHCQNIVKDIWSDSFLALQVQYQKGTYETCDFSEKQSPQI